MFRTIKITISRSEKRFAESEKRWIETAYDCGIPKSFGYTMLDSDLIHSIVLYIMEHPNHTKLFKDV